ncbi:MAG: flavodoxin family protein [Desulfatibacillaceae bacterium]
MRVLGIYGSPRKGGNTDILLDTVLEAAAGAGAETDAIYARKLRISGCVECNKCDETGQCVIDDAMQDIYPRLSAADAIVMSAPIFFYNVPGQLKLLIDRVQPMWARRVLEGKTPGQGHSSGQGYLIAVGATRGKNLFEGTELTAKYFYDALDMEYKGGLFYRKVETKGEIREHPDALREAGELGRRIVQGKK